MLYWPREGGFKWLKQSRSHHWVNQINPSPLDEPSLPALVSTHPTTGMFYGPIGVPESLFFSKSVPGDGNTWKQSIPNIHNLEPSLVATSSSIHCSSNAH